MIMLNRFMIIGTRHAKSGNLLKVLTLNLMLFISSCQSSGCLDSGVSMNNWAKDLYRSSEPGSNIKEIVSNMNTSLPESISSLYKDLLGRWNYVDDQDIDRAADAEDIAAMKNPEGDCEDFASLMFSFCRELKISARIVLAESKSDENIGHVWVDILLGNRAENIATINKISSYFDDKIILHKDSDHYWISLFPNIEEYDSYKVTHYIYYDPDFRLEKTN